MSIRVFSFGGGVQSTAALVLAAQGRVDFREFVFANVGEDSEYPGTLTYLEEHARPFAAAHGLALTEVRKHTRDGAPDSVLGRLYRTKRSVPIPMRMSNGAPGTRPCTIDFKIKVIAAHLKARGATAAAPAVVGLGISADEYQRVNAHSTQAWTTREFPLIFPHRLTREDCRNLITGAGLPVPPKSSCWFCPFHSPAHWARMRREEPALFAAAAELEAFVNTKRGALGRDQVWLTRFNKPLPMAVPDGGQLGLFDGEETDTCESGYCMT